MRKRKIILVSSAFYPEISPRSFRATELAKEFYRQGHEVTVISKFRDYDYQSFLSEFSVKFKMWSPPKYRKIPEAKSFPFSLLLRGLSRIVALLFEYPVIEEKKQVRKMLKYESGYDLLISFAVPYPVHWGVASAWTKEMRIADKWVADCGDPYMFTRLDTFRKPFYFKFLEINFCEKCDYLTVPFNEMQTQFYSQFRSKIKIIPQGFDFNEIRLFKGSRNWGKPVFKFAGSIIPGKRDLALLLDFLITLKIDFLFVVYTNQADWFSKYKEALREKMELRPYIDRLDLLYELSQSDFLVNMDTIHDDPTNTEAVPSKLIDYALTNRPILNLNSGFLDEEKVIEFLSKDYTRERIIEKSNYDIRKVSKQFLELIE